MERCCEVCGKVFFVTPADYKRHGAKFCSPACKGVYLRTNSPRLHNLFDYCGNCGKQIKITQRKVGKRNFCSRKCASRAHREYIQGENNGRYVDGGATERYSAEFLRLAPIVRDRDGQKCKLCGMTREESRKELDVHHINYDKDHNELSNLVALCHFCHGKMHGSGEQRHQWKLFWLDVLSLSQPPNESITSA